MKNKFKILLSLATIISLGGIEPLQANLKNKFKENQINSQNCDINSADFSTEVEFITSKEQQGKVDQYFCLTGKNKKELLTFLHVKEDLERMTLIGSQYVQTAGTYEITKSPYILDKSETTSYPQKDFQGWPTGKIISKEKQFNIEDNNLVLYTCYLDENYNCNNPKREVVAYENTKPIDDLIDNGDKQYELGNYNEAISYYTKSIEIKPKYQFAYAKRAESKYNLGDYKGALSDYNKAIELDPNDGISYGWRGEAHYELKQYKEAIKDLKKAIKLDPENALFNYIKLGEAHYELKQYKEVIYSFTKAIELDPNESYYYGFRADAKLKLKKYPDALSDYNKAIELDPRDSYNYLGRGNTKQSQKNLKGACEDWEKASSKGTLLEVDIKELNNKLKKYKCYSL